LSLFQTCTCGKPCCAITVDGTRKSIAKKFGAVHGQEVLANVSLDLQYHSNRIYSDFFVDKQAQFSVMLRCNDNNQNQWEVIRMSRAAK